MRISDWSSDVCSSDLCLSQGVGLARYFLFQSSLFHGFPSGQTVRGRLTLLDQLVGPGCEQRGVSREIDQRRIRKRVHIGDSEMQYRVGQQPQPAQGQRCQMGENDAGRGENQFSGGNLLFEQPQCDDEKQYAQCDGTIRADPFDEKYSSRQCNERCRDFENQKTVKHISRWQDDFFLTRECLDKQDQQGQRGMTEYIGASAIPLLGEWP